MGQRFSRRPRPSKRYEDVARPSATIQTDRLTELTKPSGGKNEDGLSGDDTASNQGEGATGMSVNTRQV